MISLPVPILRLVAKYPVPGTVQAWMICQSRSGTSDSAPRVSINLIARPYINAGTVAIRKDASLTATPSASSLRPHDWKEDNFSTKNIYYFHLSLSSQNVDQWDTCNVTDNKDTCCFVLHGSFAVLLHGLQFEISSLLDWNGTMKPLVTWHPMTACNMYALCVNVYMYRMYVICGGLYGSMHCKMNSISVLCLLW